VTYTKIWDFFCKSWFLKDFFPYFKVHRCEIIKNSLNIILIFPFLRFMFYLFSSLFKNLIILNFYLSFFFPLDFASFETSNFCLSVSFHRIYLFLNFLKFIYGEKIYILNLVLRIRKILARRKISAKNCKKNLYSQNPNLNYWKKEIIKMSWFLNGSLSFSIKISEQTKTKNLKILLC